MTIATNHLFIVVHQFVTGGSHAGAPELMTEGTRLWLHSSRPSCGGGYIGTFSTVYPHRNKAGEVVAWSPTHKTFTAHMSNVKAEGD